MDLIYTHPSGAELWQGGVPDVIALETQHNPRIKAVVLCAIDWPHPPRGSYHVIDAPMVDERNMGDEAAAMTAGIADMASTEVANHLRRGEGVLSSCAAGRNRSGLVSALTLMKVAGLQPEQAVDLVKKKRVNGDGPALTNDLFVEILHALRNRVGTMKSWTRWKNARR